MVDSAIHQINLCPADNAIDFRNTYPLDSDLSGGKRNQTGARTLRPSRLTSMGHWLTQTTPSRQGGWSSLRIGNQFQTIMECLISHNRLREEIFSRLLSEVLASVQDSVQKEMGLGLEGLRQQLSEMIATSVESSTQQAPDLARTQVGTGEQHCNSAVPSPPPPVSVCFKAKGKKHRRSPEKEKKIEFGRGNRDGYFLLIRVRLCRKEDGKFKRFARAVVTCRHRSIREIRLFRSTHCCTVNYS